MLLNPKDLALFFKLHRALMCFVNQSLHVIPERAADPDAHSSLPPARRIKVHDALREHMDLIETFAEKNPFRFSTDELDIVRSWRHLVHGTFYVFRELKRYTVFLAPGTPPIAYGVLALSQPFDELIGPYLPVMVQTNLLPFKDKIVYDGLISGFNISLGPGIRRGLNEDYKEVKARHGMVTSLPSLLRSGGSPAA